MIDVQSSADVRNVKIRKVGVKGIKHPFTWLAEADGKTVACATVGVFDLYVGLEAQHKGTHMSRFLDVLYKHVTQLSFERLKTFALETKQVLEAPTSHVAVAFTYFFQKYAPISKKAGLFEVDVSLTVNVNEKNEIQFECVVNVPVQSLCPCSKAISDYGAHNQRSIVSIQTFDSFVDIETLVRVAENAASSALYPVLKRVDEKFITEQAFQNPKFVEDLVRDAALGLKATKGVNRFVVSAENFESIHSHNVWAAVSSDDL